MTEVQRSKLNSKLGRVSQIRFCTAAGKNMALKVYTQEDATFSVKLGCKQPAEKKPYQIQYRLRSRFTPTQAKLAGAEWTKWGSWRNLIAAGEGQSAIPKGSKKDPDTWLMSNKGVNKKSDYMTFYTFNSTKIDAKYDARQYEVRIRTYGAKKRVHGAWVTERLTVYKAAVIANETIHRGASGSLMFDCNYKWERGGTVHIKSIKDSSGRNLLQSAADVPMSYDSQRTAQSTPPLRSGYTPGEFEIRPAMKYLYANASGTTGVSSVNLKRALVKGERLTWDAFYRTVDGAKTYFSSPIRVSTQDAVIDAPTIKARTDEDHGWKEIRAYKADASDAIETASCVCTYTYRGRKYTVSPRSRKLNFSVDTTTKPFATWVFRDLPLNVNLTFKVSVGNDYHSFKVVKFVTKVDCHWWLLSKVDGGKDDFAALQWNRELTVTSRPKLTTGLPHGRTKPFAAYMKGTETTLTLSGIVMDAKRAKWHRFATVESIDKLRENQGIYLLRGPRKGEMYTVAVQEVSRHSSFPDERKHEITIQMTEVI